MELSRISLIILGMMLVTTGPRLLPFMVKIEQHLPKFVLAALEYVPAAALSALIVPGIFEAGSTPVVGILGGIIAIALSWFTSINMLIVIAMSAGLCISADLFWLNP